MARATASGSGRRSPRSGEVGYRQIARPVKDAHPPADAGWASAPQHVDAWNGAVAEGPRSPRDVHGSRNDDSRSYSSLDTLFSDDTADPAEPTHAQAPKSKAATKRKVKDRLNVVNYSVRDHSRLNVVSPRGPRPRLPHPRILTAFAACLPPQYKRLTSDDVIDKLAECYERGLLNAEHKDVYVDLLLCHNALTTLPARLLPSTLLRLDISNNNIEKLPALVNLPCLRCVAVA